MGRLIVVFAAMALAASACADGHGDEAVRESGAQAIGQDGSRGDQADGEVPSGESPPAGEDPGPAARHEPEPQPPPNQEMLTDTVRLSAPRPGAYRYSLSGDRDGTEVVRVAVDENGEHRRWLSPEGSERSELLEWSEGAVRVVAQRERLDDGAWWQCTWQPPIELLRLDATAGTSWELASECRQEHRSDPDMVLRGTVEVVGVSWREVLGERVASWQVATRTTERAAGTWPGLDEGTTTTRPGLVTAGEFQRSSTAWWSTAHGMVVSDTAKIAFAGQTWRTQRELQAVPN